MITAQDIREKTFEKARIGGYDMASVDDFLEELADDLFQGCPMSRDPNLFDDQWDQKYIQRTY